MASGKTACNLNVKVKVFFTFPKIFFLPDDASRFILQIKIKYAVMMKEYLTDDVN